MYVLWERVFIPNPVLGKGSLPTPDTWDLFGKDAPAWAFLVDRQWLAVDRQHQDYVHCVEHSAFGGKVVETGTVGEHPGWR